MEEAWLDDEHSEFLEQLKMEMLEEQQREEMEMAALEEDEENDPVKSSPTSSGSFSDFCCCICSRLSIESERTLSDW